MTLISIDKEKLEELIQKEIRKELWHLIMFCAGWLIAEECLFKSTDTEHTPASTQ